MKNFQVIERSMILGYTLGYCSSSDTFVIFTDYVSDVAIKVINSVLDLHPKSCIKIVTDEDRAKQISLAPQWLKALSELGVN